MTTTMTTDTAKAYQRGKDLFFYTDLFLNIIFLVMLMVSGFSVSLRNWAATRTANAYFLNAFYFAVLYGLMFLLFLPVNFFQEYIWEHKFNLSTRRIFSWLGDHLKKSLLGFALTILVVEVVYLFLTCFPTTWWIWASVFWLFLTIVLSRITPSVIIPLFYKYSPVQDENLRAGILEIFKQCGLKIKDVYLIDLSKKTKKANAFICGLGASRRIVLSDTLVSNYTIPEIETVVAHEIGHHQHKDIWRLMAVNTATTFLGFFLMDKFLNYALVRLNLGRIDDIAFFPVLALGMMIFNFLAMPFLNAFSRRIEVRADEFSLNLTKNPQSFISMMEKLGVQNFAEFEPHWLKEWMFYDHPSIAKRIKLAANFNPAV